MVLGANNFPTGEVLTWSLVLIGLMIIAFVVVTVIKRRVSASDEAHGSGFTLGDLRELHRTGKITDEEFTRARDQMIAAATRAMARQEKPAGNQRLGDRD